jgi:dipeptidyl aminopeptidase/acylaminoacyl peptidase
MKLGNPWEVRMTRAPVAMLLLASTVSIAQGAEPVDAAAAFGARPSVSDIALSPDGTSLAYVGAAAGPGSVLYTIDLAKDSEPKVALYSDGRPDRIGGCHWVSNQRLACFIVKVVSNGLDLMTVTRWVALDRDGSAITSLSGASNDRTEGHSLWGGAVIDWLPEENGAVLMTRQYLPGEHLGSHIGSDQTGLGVDWIDTRSMQVKHIESPGDSVKGYETDGHGTVRIMIVEQSKIATGGETGLLDYRYRKTGSREWLKLAEFNRKDYSGFQVQTVDRNTNLAYGSRLLDGRTALYTMALDGSLAEKLVCSRPDADIGGWMAVGRGHHVIGGYYFTDVRRSIYFDPDSQHASDMLTRALPSAPSVSIVDSSADESKLLVFANAADDPGRYYLFDRGSKQLRPLLFARMALQGYKFAKVQPVQYPATDSTMVSGYLTLPPGTEHAQGLPAIVLLRSNLDANDYWGANWLSQYYATRGFVVLQANIRGTAGFGDRSPGHSPFKSWRMSVGDALDAGHWLVHQGVADPSRLFIVGWSFGGYVALQSAVVEPDLYKAVVAIGPITDLSMLKEQWRDWSNFGLMEDFVGAGSDLKKGSPAQNAAQIKAPVLLFHGALDRLASIGQSKRMADALQAAGVKHELVTWEQLGADIDDSTARAQLLRKSDEFLRQVAGTTH